MNSVLYYLPRVGALALILALIIYAIQAVDPSGTAGRIIGDFLLNLIPAALMAILTGIAWNREYYGGVLLIIWGVIMAIIWSDGLRIFGAGAMTLSGLIMLLGIIFLVSRYALNRSRGHRTASEY